MTADDRTRRTDADELLVLNVRGDPDLARVARLVGSAVARAGDDAERLRSAIAVAFAEMIDPSDTDTWIRIGISPAPGGIVVHVSEVGAPAARVETARAQLVGVADDVTVEHTPDGLAIRLLIRTSP